MSINKQGCENPTEICPNTRSLQNLTAYNGFIQFSEHIIVFEAIFRVQTNTTVWLIWKKTWKQWKIPGKSEIFADFSLRIRNRFKLRKRSESESILKIAKRKRSEVESFLCEAKRSEFASLRNFSQSCEFALRIWSPATSRLSLKQ